MRMPDEKPEDLTMILVDSPRDAAAFRELGFKSIRIADREESVCVMRSGEAVTDPSLEFFDKFVLAVRSHELRDGLAVRIGDLKCSWIDWSGTPGSASETLEHHGRDALLARFHAARPMWLDEVCLASDVPESGPMKGYKTGFRALDEHGFRVVRPAFMTVIGPYASGKSVFARQMAANFWRMHGWRTLITSFEERIKPVYVESLRRNLIGSEAMGHDGWVPKAENTWTAADIAEADRQIDLGFRFLRRKRNSNLDQARLIDRIEYAVRVYGVDVVILDPVNELDIAVPRGVNKTDVIGGMIMELKQIADDYNLLMIVLAHPAKDGVRQRATPKIYTLNDGADTAHYGNKSDIGLCVWRPTMAPDCPTFLNIDKLKRQDVMGRPTMATLTLDCGAERFSVAEIGHERVIAALERAVSGGDG